MSNFYSSPTDEDLPESPELQHRAKVRRVANRHRIALILFVVNILVVVAVGLVYFRVVEIDQSFERTAVAMVLGVICVSNATVAWLLARELHSATISGLLALVCAAPGLAVLGMAWLSIVANHFLVQQGVRVGVLGADPGQIR